MADQRGSGPRAWVRPSPVQQPPPLSILPLPPLLSRQVQEKAQCRFYLLSHPAPPAPPLAAPRAGSCGGGATGGVRRRRRRRRRQLLPQGAAGAGRLRGAVRLVMEPSARRLKRHTGCSARTVLHGRHERQRTPVPAVNGRSGTPKRRRPEPGPVCRWQAGGRTAKRCKRPEFAVCALLSSRNAEGGVGRGVTVDRRRVGNSHGKPGSGSPAYSEGTGASRPPLPDGHAGTGSFYRRQRRYGRGSTATITAPHMADRGFGGPSCIRTRVPAPDSVAAFDSAGAAARPVKQARSSAPDPSRGRRDTGNDPPAI